MVDLTTLTVAQLFSQYRILQIRLTPPNTNTDVYLLLSDIVNDYATYSGYFSDLVAGLNGASLPTRTDSIALNSRSAAYTDAYQAGFAATPVDANNIHPVVSDVRQLPNVRISRNIPPISYGQLINTCLFNVNGYYHSATHPDDDGIMIKDAVSSLLISGQNQIGIWSFANVATLTTLAVTPAMCTINQGVANINLGVDLTNKTVAMVIGGYFTWIDNDVLTQIGPQQCQVNFNRIDLVNRYFESANYLDISSILALTPAANPDQIVIADLVSDTAVAAWLAMSQTFFVIFDKKEMYMERQFVKKIGIPNVYLSYSKPKHPLALSLGRHPPYWTNQEAGQWTLKIYDNNIGNLLYNTAIAESTSANGANQPNTTGPLQNAYLIQVGTDIA